mgnify:CR=1 FL=1|tara:strand:- start:14401 stop:14556 length:156 start_codon:yes stop_codon:yes gene_type:complete
MPPAVVGGLNECANCFELKSHLTEVAFLLGIFVATLIGAFEGNQIKSAPIE